MNLCGLKASLRSIGSSVIIPTLFVICFSGMQTRRNAAASDQMSRFPSVVLWAWERREDLSFIDPQKIGVAYLAETINLTGSQAIVRPRLQPLIVPTDTKMMAVVRIELDRSQPSDLGPAQLDRVASLLVREATSRPLAAIQIDFDAPRSARPFYRNLLFELRRRLPTGFPLSITALASWCIGDNWLSGLPVDEAVPMLFRMGADRMPVLNHLESGGDFRARPARGSLGISVDEPITKLPTGRRVYVFNPKPWSEAALNTVAAEMSQW